MRESLSGRHLIRLSKVAVLLALTAGAVFGQAKMVISQVYGGGGSSGTTAPLSTYQRDYIELFNAGNAAQNINGWTVKYASAAGTTWSSITLPNVSVPAGGYYLIVTGGTGTTGAVLTGDTTSTTISMSATDGKVALFNANPSISGACPTDAALVDFVAYGTVTCSEGSATGTTSAPQTARNTADVRAANGCTDTGNNTSDFAAVTNPVPRTTASALNPCGGGPGPTSPSGVGAASPNSITPPANTLLTVTVTPGANPTSTGITVTANLSTINLSATQQFFDNATNGDVTAGDNVFSFLAAVPNTVTAGVKTLPATIQDAQARSGSANISLTILAPVSCSPTNNIHDVQGNGNTSPLVGQAVAVEGIVTGRKSNGFFLQNPDNLTDADPATSEGVFVFTSAANLPATAVAGNQVCVAGTVQEFIPGSDPGSPPITEISSMTSFLLINTGNPLPTPVVLTAADTPPGGSIDVLERFESMRVRVNSLTVVGPTQGNTSEVNATSTSTGVFHGVITGVARPFREAGVRLPDALPPGSPASVTRWDANTEILRIDSVSIGGPAIDVTSGATVAPLSGPLDYVQRAYTIAVEPTAGAVVTGGIVSATPVPAPVPNEYTIGSFNMERFFDTVNDPSIGEPTLTATAFNNRLQKASLAIRNVMRSPDIIGVQEVENLTTLQSVAGKLNDDTVAAGQPNPGYIAFLVEGNDPGGIDVGFLIKSARIETVSVTQIGKTDTYIDPNNGQPDLLNDRPPLVLRAQAKLAGNVLSAPFLVIVNHLRSLNGIDDPADGNRVRTKRRAQAEFLANLIQGFQTAEPGIMISSVGDYNAFRVSDGYVDLIGTILGSPTPASQVVLASADLVNPNLTDLVDTLPPSQQYSYVFGGSAQTLDHALVSQSLLSRLTRFAYARNDADFPEAFRNDPNRPERLSDHDMPVAYFAMTTAANLTGKVTLTRSALVYNRAARTFTGTITVTNTSGQLITGPLNIVLRSLTVGVTLVNASGTWLGSPFLTVNVGAGLAAGASVVVPMTFNSPTNLLIAYVPVAYSDVLN
ncbi:MAG: lamin tail domain-containing protein [Acidobacteria bacterium]|nr:lamin tail domain-containing protein [Acidobacteriota bacterium]